MRALRPLLLLGLCACLVSFAARPAEAAPPRCDMREVTVNGTSALFHIGEFAGAVASWLVITNAGSGTPSVEVDVIGPPITATGTATGATGRPAAMLCTMNAALTTCGTRDLIVNGLQSVVTGCTGTCDLWIGLCVGDN